MGKYSEVPNRRLIEEHARLDFFDFLSTLFAIFHVINLEFHPARLLIYLVKKQAGWFFFQTCLFIPVCSSISKSIALDFLDQDIFYTYVYRIVTTFNTSRLEAHPCIFRLLILKGDFWCLFTVTFWQKVDFLNSNTCKYSQLYGIW